MNKRKATLVFCLFGVLIAAALLVTLLLFILPDGDQSSSVTQPEDTASFRSVARAIFRPFSVQAAGRG